MKMKGEKEEEDEEGQGGKGMDITRLYPLLSTPQKERPALSSDQIHQYNPTRARRCQSFILMFEWR